MGEVIKDEAFASGYKWDVFTSGLDEGEFRRFECGNSGLIGKSIVFGELNSTNRRKVAR